MNLRSSHLANQGARLAGFSASRAEGAPAGRGISRDGQSALRASPDHLSSPASVPAGPAREPVSQAPFEGSRASIPADPHDEAARLPDQGRRDDASPGGADGIEGSDGGTAIATAKTGSVAGAPDSFLLTLTPNVQATLLLAAKAAGTTPAEFIARAIVAHALEAVGFPDLSDEFTAVPAFSRIGETRFRSGGP